MNLKSIYSRFALLSPYAEITLRHIYWHNDRLLKRFSPNKPAHSTDLNCVTRVDFEKVVDWLKSKGVGKGSLLLVHSGYAQLERTGLSPDQIVDRLLELVGPTGTLAMPVIRRFKEIEKAKKEGLDSMDVICKYDIQKTVIISGLLPYTLLHKDGAVISHHPFNPLCAIGPLAEEMMSRNLDGDAPTPHGPNSAWMFCLDHGAKVCSIGTDIEHHNTIGHVAEEAFGDWYWPDDVWYNRYRFIIIDEERNSREIVVRNRKNAWGAMHLAEINACREEKRVGAMESGVVDGITVGYVDPQMLIGYLRSRNKKGYPYFVFPWERVEDFK